MQSDPKHDNRAHAAPPLTPEEMDRYARHLTLPQVGAEGQQKLKAARILCVGAGGLGSPALLYLAAAGVGTLGIVDADVVDASNLQRQVLHGANDVGRAKTDSSAERLRALNPHLSLQLHHVRLTHANALEIFADYDIILDGTDNFAARYAISDACVQLGKPHVYAAVDRFEGQASVFAAVGTDGKRGPCYRCLHPAPPPPESMRSCNDVGVLGVLPGVLGLIQATETLKLILGCGEPLIARLLLFDALAMRFREIVLRRNPNCSGCGDTLALAKTSTVKDNMSMVNGIPQITPAELKRRLDAGETLCVLDVREPHEFARAQIGGTLIPLNDLPQRLHELDRSQEIVVHCKMGGRSQKAAEFLAQAGFTRLHNLAGGILAWSETVDPSVPKY